MEFRDALPTTNVGKILRRELRDAPMVAEAGRRVKSAWWIVSSV